MILFLAVTGVQAANQYWDSSTNAGFQHGNGIWSTSASDTNWSGLTGTNPLAMWTNGSTAVFSATGGASLVTLNNTAVQSAGISIGGSAYSLILTNGGRISNAVTAITLSGGTNRVEVSGGGTASYISNSMAINIGLTNGYNEFWVNGGGVAGGAFVTNSGAVIVGSGSGSLMNHLAVTNGGYLFGTAASSVGASSSFSNKVEVTGGGALWNGGGQTLSVGVGTGANANSLVIDGQGVAGGARVTNVSTLYVGVDAFGIERNSVLVTNGGVLNLGAGTHIIGGQTAGSIYSSTSNRLDIVNGGRIYSAGPIYVGKTAPANQGSHWDNKLVVRDSTSLLDLGGFALVLGFFNGGGLAFNVSGNELIVDGGVATNVGAITISSGAGGGGTTSVYKNGLVVTNGGRLYSRGPVVVGQISNNWAIITGTESLWDVGGSNLTIGGTAAYASNNWMTIDQGATVRNGGTLTVYSTNTLELRGGTLTFTNLTSTMLNRFDVGDGTQSATLGVLGGAFSFPWGLSISSNATLTGWGIVTGGVTGVEMTNGAAIAPGWSGVGALTIKSNLTWYGGATYRCDITNVLTGAGAGWDVLNVSSQLMLMTGGSPCWISIESQGQAVSGFLPGSDYNFLIMTLGTASGFDTNKIAIRTNDFVSSANGTWGVTNLGTNVYLTYRAAASESMVYTWDAPSNGNWSVGMNWTNRMVPVTYSPSMTLQFGVGASTPAYRSTNNFGGSFILNRWVLTNANATVTNYLVGNGVEFWNPGARLEQGGSGGVMISNNVNLQADLILGGTGSGQVTLAGAMSGSGALTKQGSSTMILSASNNFSGLVTVDGAGGVMRMDNVNALGNNSLVVSNGTLWNTNIWVFGNGPYRTGRVVGSGAGSLWTNSLALTVASNGMITVADGGRLICGALTIANEGTANTGLSVTNGSLLYSTGAANIGNTRSNCQMTIRGGGSVWNANTQFLAIGTGASATGNVLYVDGAGVAGGARLTNVAAITVGSTAGSAFNGMVITNGGQVFSQGASVIGNISSNNAVWLAGAGSLWDHANSNLMIGSGASATGNVLYVDGRGVAGGARMTNLGVITVGTVAGSAFNGMVLTNGGQVVSQGASVIGGTSSSNNTVLVTGAGSRWNTVNSNLTIGSANYLNNLLKIDQTGAVLNVGTLTVSPTNELILSGGTLSASNLTSTKTSLFTAGDGVQSVSLVMLGGGIWSNNAGILIQTNTTVSGRGFMTGGTGGVTFLNGSTLIPGLPGSATNTLGTIGLGNSTWNGGMTLELNITNVAGSGGTGWDLVQVAGMLNFVPAGGKLIIKLDSLGETVGGFDANTPRAINLVDFSAASISTNDIEVDTSKFLIGSGWFLEVTVTDIRYVYRRANSAIYVATNGNNTAGTNWTTAFSTLSNALNFAQNYDTIYVAGQTFYLTNQIVLSGKSGISICGGYAASNNTALPGDRDITRWPTILCRTSNAVRVLLASGVTNGLLEGLTFTGGAISAPSGATSRGAGLYASNCMGLVVADCIITNNSAAEGSAAYGGGIGQLGGALTIRNCVIKENVVVGQSSGSSYGAGLYVASGSCSVTNTVIANNRGTVGATSPGQGGGIWSAGRLALRNCLLFGNAAAQIGHGIYFSGGTGIVENCTIANNFTNGIYQTNGVVMITNSIVWGNGDDLVVVGAATNILGSSSIEDGDNLGINGCTSSDPMFEYGFYLGTASLCVDGGISTASAWGLDTRTTRIDGQPDAGVVDLGYHYLAGRNLTYANIYVTTNGLDSNSGTNWAQAFRTVTKALSVAIDGSAIRIGEGRYTNGIERETFSLSINDRAGLQILGAGRDVTFIDARNTTNRVLSCQNSARLVLADLTFIGGTLTGSANAGSGGGLYFNNCDSALMAGCNIISNQCSDSGVAYGGGVQSLMSSLTLSNCLFYANKATGTGSGKGYGGAVALMSGSLRAIASDFANNATVSAASQAAYGVGLFNNAAFMELRNCLIRGNSGAHTNSGAIYSTGGQLQIIGSTLAYNPVVGLMIPAGSASLTNSILWGNMDDICSTGNVVNLSYCNVENGDSNGVNGCISSDPRFEYGFYLGSGSLCVNAGTNGASDWGQDARTTRIDGQTDTGAVDLGYHYSGGFDLTYADIYVATNGDNSYTGTNSLQAFRTLTKALSVARAGTRIHMGMGIYSNGLETMPMTIEDRPGLQVLGTSRTGTVIHGMNKQRVLSLLNNNGQIRMESLSVMGGTTNSAAPHPDTGDGCGLLVNNCGDLTLSDCNIMSNQCSDTAVAYGGGLMAQVSAVTITNCAFTGNKAAGSGNGWGYGGGVALLSGTMRIIDSDFANNAGTSAGKVGYGAAFYNTGWMEIRNCLVRGNTGAYTNGGAITTGGGDLRIIGSTLAYNGIACIVRNAGTIAATNTIWWGNTDDIYPLVNNVNLAYCDIENGDSNGVNGCISSNPWFESGFFLGSGSLCINGGTNPATYWGMDKYTTQTSGDLDAGQVDIGYHYTNTGAQAQGLVNIYVATNGLDTHSGTNWAEAFRTLTKALSVAIDGSVISVGEGQFTNGVGLEIFPLTVSGRNGLQILGSGQNSTIIDAKASNRALTFLNSNGRIVLSDLTIMGGRTNTSSASGLGSGGGLYFDNCGNVQILRCTIASNECGDAAAANGAGLMAQASAVTVSNCYFNGNLAEGSGNGYGKGGAFAVLSGSLRVIDTVIANNLATAAGKTSPGAALYNLGATELRNCLVQGNNGIYTNGGALYNAGGSLQIIGSTLAYNGVVCIVPVAGTVSLTNSIMWGNIDDIYTPGVAVNLAYCDVENGDSNGVNGCISSDPLFTSGYYLGNGSLCIDGGTNNATAWGMDQYTTQTSDDPDAGRVDIGYHYTNGTGQAQGLAEIYVATNGLDTQSGTNWLEAFRTITKAVSRSMDGSIIRIGAGQYTNGLETFPLTIQGKNGFQILGAGSDLTVLDAKLTNRVMKLLNNNGRVVIDGLMLTGGKAAGGGGLLVDTCGDVLISDCAVSNNQANAVTPQGGGIWLTRSTVTISNCVVTMNTGVRIPNGTAYGGGIDLDSGVLVCRDTILSSNRVSDLGYGGGLRVGTLARAVVRNCLVTTNSATSGHGIYNSGTLFCESVTIANNKGEGVANAGTLAITNGLIWGNGDDVTGTVTLAYCDIEDGDNNGTNGCISDDPKFVNAPGGNYLMGPGSPAINRGIKMPWMTGSKDLLGNPRVQAGAVDIGAYESPIDAGTIFMIR